MKTQLPCRAKGLDRTACEAYRTTQDEITQSIPYFELTRPSRSAGTVYLAMTVGGRVASDSPSTLRHRANNCIGSGVSARRRRRWGKRSAVAGKRNTQGLDAPDRHLEVASSASQGLKMTAQRMPMTPSTLKQKAA